VEVIPVSFPLRFPSQTLFIAASIIGSAAAVKALAELSHAEQSHLIEVLDKELKPVLAPYKHGEAIIFPLGTNIGRGFV
jgi:hypothetical protein